MANRFPVSAVVLGDDKLFRSGLRELLDADGIDVAGEGGLDGEVAHLLEETEPDVVAVDPGTDAAGLIPTLAASRVRGVLVIADSAAPDEVLATVAAGAAGYVLKTASGAELAAAVRTVAAGGTAWSRPVADALAASAGLQRAGTHLNADLSDRELEVLRLVVEGRDNPDIARELYISQDTVKNHVSNILNKLGVDNRIQAAVQAVRTRLV